MRGHQTGVSSTSCNTAALTRTRARSTDLSACALCQCGISEHLQQATDAPCRISHLELRFSLLLHSSQVVSHFRRVH